MTMDTFPAVIRRVGRQLGAKRAAPPKPLPEPKGPIDPLAQVIQNEMLEWVLAKMAKLPPNHEIGLMSTHVWEYENAEHENPTQVSVWTCRGKTEVLDQAHRDGLAEPERPRPPGTRGKRSKRPYRQRRRRKEGEQGKA